VEQTNDSHHHCIRPAGWEDRSRHVAEDGIHRRGSMVP
jgi:hypothetical protein